MKVRVFEFRKISISCVGTNDAMDDLLAFYNHKCETKTDLYIDSMIQRINTNKIYCYITPQSFLYKLESIKIKSLIKKELLIEDWMFVDAMFLSEPKKMCNEFGITMDYYENEIKPTSCWKCTDTWNDI